ncbi:hypothetical protein [Parabacteroides sp. PF5-9]|uniref:hypothetical protein n=1 Tax=Parabacteroides sp. PF5-9 TaxID=1742404 RepID=UPI0024761B74|nr:hypothetical protein [Parabacteroides sp. PF5-9]
MRTIHAFFQNKLFPEISHNNNAFGTVYLYTDQKLPIKKVRDRVCVALETDPEWNKRGIDILVKDVQRRYIELFIPFCTTDSQTGHDLQMDMHERMVAVVHEQYPNCMVKTRIEIL